MSNPVDFSVKPFARGVLKDIPSQFMPTGGLTHGLGVRIDDAFIEKRLGFRRISDCQYDEYILGLYQYLSPDQVPHVFFGDRYHLYHIGYGPALRFWDDGYPWWDIPGYAWDALAGGVTYELSPWGSHQICPPSSESFSSIASSSHSEFGTDPCEPEHYPFTGRDHRDANGETSSWIFTDFAGNIIATNYEDPIVIIRGYNYALYENLNCMGLRARIIDNFQNHIMALNTVDSIDGQVVNRIWWSDLDDAENWEYTVLASESGYVDLEPSSMPITGGAKLRDSYIVYQSNMIHQLNYVGGTNIFSKQVINKEIGCMSKSLLCSDGEKHFFFAQNDIWMFDGYNFKPIGINNNEYIYEGLNKAQISRAFSFIDVNTNEAHFVIPWKSTIPNLDCIYDYIHDLWTFDFLDVNGCEGATAGCPRVAFDFPYIARVGSRISSSSSSCSVSSSTSTSSSSICSSSISHSSYSYSISVDCKYEAAKRFYFPSTGTPPVSPAYSASWDQTSEAARLELVSSKIGSAFAQISLATHAGGVGSVLGCQYVSEALNAQNVPAGHVSGQIRAYETSGGLNATVAFNIRVCDSLGNITQTVLDVQASDNTTSTPPEISNVFLINRSFQNSAESTSIPYNSFTVNAGDRLVIEWGFRENNTNSSRRALFSIGDNSATDLPIDNTNNTDICPWIEFDRWLCLGSNSSSSSSSSSISSYSSSISSSSQSSSSNSFSSEGAHADSFIEEVGSTLNDDGWPRVSEWISGEYTTFNPEVPIDQYIKEIREITPIITDITNDVHITLGARDRTDTATAINWETLAAFTQQELVGTTTYGRYLSFKCVASSLNDYYEISELMGSYVVAGRR